VAGRGGIVLIGGKPGEGKTRLGEEALEMGLARGMLPLLGQAYEEQGAPFIVSTEIIEDIQRALPPEVLRNAMGDTAAEIARLVPDLRRTLPDIPEAPELPAEQQQRYFFNAMLEFTNRLAGACPLVYLLDDLQWADESSVQLLEHVAPHLPRLPVLMVITYRDVAADLGEPFKRALSRLSHQDYVTRIRLHHLGRDAVAGLLESLAGSPAPEPVVRGTGRGAAARRGHPAGQAVPGRALAARAPARRDRRPRHRDRAQGRYALGAWRHSRCGHYRLPRQQSLRRHRGDLERSTGNHRQARRLRQRDAPADNGTFRTYSGEQAAW
jgi:hypothetical protein